MSRQCAFELLEGQPRVGSFTVIPSLLHLYIVSLTVDLDSVFAAVKRCLVDITFTFCLKMQLSSKACTLCLLRLPFCLKILSSLVQETNRGNIDLFTALYLCVYRILLSGLENTFYHLIFFFFSQVCIEKHVAAEGFMVYGVVCKGLIECSNTLEDEEDAELLPQALVYKPCRQRIYGLLLLLEHDGRTVN